MGNIEQATATANAVEQIKQGLPRYLQSRLMQPPPKKFGNRGDVRPGGCAQRRGSKVQAGMGRPGDPFVRAAMG